jgi:multidrug efflux pump
VRFTDIFIRRPVLATVLSLLILLVGLAALFSLPVRQYPELSNTTITVTTTYPGASAELVKGFITTPIEQAVSSTEGLDTLVSNSRQNVSTVTLNLKLNADADRAVADVLSKVNLGRRQRPDFRRVDLRHAGVARPRAHGGAEGDGRRGAHRTRQQ